MCPVPVTCLECGFCYICNSDIASLARAAVSGDESALDMFSWQAKKGGKAPLHISSASLGPQESLCFFIGGKNGEFAPANPACGFETYV